MNLRRKLLYSLGAVALVPFRAFAQQPVKVWRIGFLGTTSAAGYVREIEAIRAGLRDLGYAEGRNIAFDFRWGEGKHENLAGLARELVALNPDLIIASLTPAILAAKAATTRIPIVMTPAGDPVGLGIVDSLARPGGNVTGMAAAGGELAAKNFEVIRAVLPSAKQVAVLANTTDPFSKTYLSQVQNGANALGIRLRIFPIRDEGELEAAFGEMAKARVAAVMIQGSLARGRTVELAIRHRIPALSSTPGFAEAGALFSYTSDVADQFRNVAGYVDRIVRGAKPADLPIQLPTKFEFVVNLRTAKAIRVAIPNAVLLRADRIIE